MGAFAVEEAHIGIIPSVYNLNSTIPIRMLGVDLPSVLENVHKPKLKTDLHIWNFFSSIPFIILSSEQMQYFIPPPTTLPPGNQHMAPQSEPIQHYNFWCRFFEEHLFVFTEI